MIVVTHEMGFARQVADRVVFMDSGEIVEINAPDAFFDHPQHERTQDLPAADPALSVMQLAPPPRPACGERA